MGNWRLGLDIGTNSIGWARLGLDFNADTQRLEPSEILELGVRILPDGREPARGNKGGLPRIGAPRAVARREARSMRRNRDRHNLRVREGVARFVRYGLVAAVPGTVADKLPKGIFHWDIDPYAARAKAAREPVSREELARALLHIFRRRGFRSNRKADTDAAETTERNQQMDRLSALLHERGCTLGQFLFERLQQGSHVRFRGREYADTTDPATAIYPRRNLYEEEFNAIRTCQGNRFLTDEQWDDLYSLCFSQRPLKQQIPGLCAFEHGRNGREEHRRASRHLPLAHTFRIVQEVNNLCYTTQQKEQMLTPEQRQYIYELLEKQQTATFKAIRKKLKLPDDAQFNLESERRNKLEGNITACFMRKQFAVHEQNWDILSATAQNDFVEALLRAEDSDAFAAQCATHWQLPASLAQDVFVAWHPPAAHGHLSRVCMEKLLPLMRKGKRYWEAATEIYGDHTDYSRFATGEVLEKLPYYGEILFEATAPVRETDSTPDEEKAYGRITNPTVHVVLNQLRKLVNKLIERHGNPCDIHLELARELKITGKRYEELLDSLEKNQKKNEQLVAIYQEAMHCGKKPGRYELRKLRLWDELPDKIDIYTGKPISLAQVLSDAIEVEHILPYSKTNDNSNSNCTVTFREVNRRKGGDQLPYEFALNDRDIDAEAMLMRAKKLPSGKRWRFQSDALDIYKRIISKNMTAEEKRLFDADNSGGFIDRQLVDTQYVSKLAARYLVPIVGDPKKVVPVNGAITATIRGCWRINAIKHKGGANERMDHRHHAEDALIVALADRSLVKRIADKTRQSQEANRLYDAKLVFPDRPAWAGDAQIAAAMDKINVSFRQDHNNNGKFYEDTAYRLLPDHATEGNAVVRRSITALKENEVAQVRDVAVRTAIQNFLEQPHIKAISKWPDRLAELVKQGIYIGKAQRVSHVRHVRVLVKDQSLVSIPDSPHKAYAPGEYAFCEIWKLPVRSGRAKNKFCAYQGVCINYALAQQYAHDPDGLHNRTRPHPAAKMVMRLYKNDMVVVYDKNGEQSLCRIAGFRQDNRVDLRTHTTSDMSKCYKSIQKLFDEMHMRKVYVTIDGKILGGNGKC